MTKKFELTIVYGNKIIFDEKSFGEEPNEDDMLKQVSILAKYTEDGFRKEGKYLGMINGEYKYLVEVVGNATIISEIDYIETKYYDGKNK